NAREVLTIDARSGKILAHAPAGEYPDGLAWDPVERHVFVSDESGGVETMIDDSGNRIATIDLGGEAGNRPDDAGSRGLPAPPPPPGASSPTCRRGTTSPSSTRERTRSSTVSLSRDAPTTMASTSTRPDGSRSSPATRTHDSSPSTCGR